MNSVKESMNKHLCIHKEQLMPFSKLTFPGVTLLKAFPIRSLAFQILQNWYYF